MKKQYFIFAAFLVIGLLVSTGPALTQKTDVSTNAIVATATQSLQHPGWEQAGEIEIDPADIKLSGDYALISWTHSHEGGMMVLQRKNSVWEVLGSVGGVMDATLMVDDGVPVEHANELWRQWANEE